MVTLKDIAKIAAVSEATASRSLNDNAMISLKTRQRIQAIAKELGYSKNAVALGLSTGSSRVIGLIVSQITNPFYAELAHGIGNTARRQGFGLILCNTDSDPEIEAYYAQFLWSQRVSGIILASSIPHEPIVEQIQQKLPMVLLSRMMNQPEYNYVACDDVAGSRVVIDHFVKHGHRRIAYIGGPIEMSTSWLRFQGYRQALKSHGLPYRKSLCHFGTFESQTGQHFAKVLLRQKRPPTAVFAANDLIALGVMEAVANLGLSVPKNLALIGYDNIPAAALPQIQLTTVEQPLRAMGACAAKILIDEMNQPHAGVIQKNLNPKLIVRKSCGA